MDEVDYPNETMPIDVKDDYYKIIVSKIQELRKSYKKNYNVFTYTITPEFRETNFLQFSLNIKLIS